MQGNVGGQHTLAGLGSSHSLSILVVVQLYGSVFVHLPAEELRQSGGV